MTQHYAMILWPYLAVLAGCVVVLRVLLVVSGARARLAEAVRLHGDERGGVQSLSFVLTLPVFVLFLLLIVQVSQLAIARVYLEEAAFAAARSAVVWIPANLAGGDEQENQIDGLTYVGDLPGPDADTTFHVYEVAPGSVKFQKIHLAAAMALLPVCPSRDAGASGSHPSMLGLPSLEAAYYALTPEASRNTKIPDRLRNKLAYALEHTQVRIVIHHKEDREQPPLAWWDVGPHFDEFAPHEIGYQDQIFVTVTHDFALLPGPARVLARPPQAAIGSDPQGTPGGPSQAPAAGLANVTVSSSAQVAGPNGPTSGGATSGGTASKGQNSAQAPSVPQSDGWTMRIRQNGGTYVYPISASVRLTNEGQKPLLSYVQSLDGRRWGFTPPPPELLVPQTQNPCPTCPPGQ